jgi:hypothetical protein
LDSVQRSAGEGFRGDVRFASGDTELVKRVSEETDFAATVASIIAKLSAVTGRMQPIFKHVVCIGAVVTESARAFFLHGRAGNAGVGVNLRVSTACFFLRMCKRALCPVMYKAFRAWYNLYKGEKEEITMSDLSSATGKL